MMDNPNLARFEEAYQGQPPWDLGQPQLPFVELADRITGTVLDAGCGTGDNAIFFAQRGQPVLGIDFVESALAAARQKAAERGVQIEFKQHDALQLDRLGRTFDSVIDCGLFHVFSDEDRVRYVEQLAKVTQLRGNVFLMCFSDRELGDGGPRRISQDEIRAAFANGWSIESITATRFRPNPNAAGRNFSDGGPHAWFAIIRRETLGQHET
jgi:SAM-dependent methyltransferase